MTADIRRLAPKVRASVAVADEHWLWTGSFSRSAARIGGIPAKPVVWQMVTGEQLHPNDRVIRDCAERRCVNPDHQHIGDLDEVHSAGGRNAVGVKRNGWAA